MEPATWRSREFGVGVGVCFGLWFRVWGLGWSVEGFAFKICDFGFGVGGDIGISICRVYFGLVG